MKIKLKEIENLENELSLCDIKEVSNYATNILISER